MNERSDNQADLRRHLADQYRILENGCWEWQGKRWPVGYGYIFVAGQHTGAHRVSYRAHVGPIPESLVLDHLCRNRACINPAHLEPVTHRENLLRGMSPMAVAIRTGLCLRGHSRTEPGAVKAGGECRKCTQANQKRRREEREAANPELREKRLRKMRERRLRRENMPAA